MAEESLDNKDQKSFLSDLTRAQNKPEICSAERQITIEPNNLFPRFNIKDKGYALVPVYAMFVSNTICTGYIKGFGIIFTAVKDLHPEISVTTAGVMMGLLTGFRCIFSPAGGALANTIGIRSSMFLGTTLSFVALVTAFFCSSAIGYAITLGAMSGLGQCIIESTHVITLSHYFDKKMSFANGIRVAGSSFGGIIIPLILAFLLQYFGVRLSFLMLAALVTQIYICTALTMPINLHLRICSLKYINSCFKKKNKEDLTLLHQQNESRLLSKDMQNKKKQMFQELMSCYPNINDKRKKKSLDFSFFKNPVYLLFLAMASGMPMVSLLTYYMCIYAKEVVGLPVRDISILLSIESIIDLFFRLFFGYLNSKHLYKLVNGFKLSLLISIVGSVCMPFTTGFYSILVVHFLCSVGYNAYNTFVNVILCDQFGAESIASTYGFVRMTQGIFSFIHPALIGYLVDITGGFMIPYIVMGSGLLFAFLAMMIEPLVIKLSNSKFIIS